MPRSRRSRSAQAAPQPEPARTREQFPRSTRTVAGGGRIPPGETYPASVAECLDDDRKYKPAAIAAIRAFRRAKPWRGTPAERVEKLSTLHRALCDAYGITPRLVVSPCVSHETASGSSSYSPYGNTITLRGRLSVVTYLHEFAHALGYGEQGACRWSINLFRRFFPQSYARLRHSGHCLVRDGERNAERDGEASA